MENLKPFFSRFQKREILKDRFCKQESKYDLISVFFFTQYKNKN